MNLLLFQRLMAFPKLGVRSDLWTIERVTYLLQGSSRALSSRLSRSVLDLGTSPRKEDVQ